MIRKYIGTFAMAITAMALFACKRPQPNDLFVMESLAPALSGMERAGTLGPVIWEIIPPGNKMYEKGIPYTVELLDAERSVIESYSRVFQSPRQDTSSRNARLIDVVSVVLATEQQMQYPLEANPLYNPRFVMPRNTSYVRVRVDPDNRIRESNENNNSIELRIHQR